MSSPYQIEIKNDVEFVELGDGRFLMIHWSHEPVLFYPDGTREWLVFPDKPNA